MSRRFDYGTKEVVQYLFSHLRCVYDTQFEAYFHRYDAPRHVEALKALVEKAFELGLGIFVQINNMKVPLPYDGLPAAKSGRFFYGVEIMMSAEEVKNFFTARGL
jgi:hypothetical protein